MMMRVEGAESRVLVIPGASPLEAVPSARLAGSTIRRLGVALAGLGWLGMAAMWLTGSVETFGHDQQGLPAILAIGLFLIGWQVMVAAMMLPSSLSTLARVDRAMADRAPEPAIRFMFGYFWVWAVFGAAAFAADGVLHLTVANVPWLAERPWLVLAGISVFAGGAEMLGRTPPPRMPDRPATGTFALGRAHAEDRIRRCWPMMLFAMAVGMSSPLWMVGLTGVMALELQPRAELALRLVGAGVAAMGIAVIVEPGLASVLLEGP